MFVHCANDCLHGYGLFGVVEELVYDVHDFFYGDDAVRLSFVRDGGLHALVGDAFVPNLHVSKRDLFELSEFSFAVL